MKQLVQRAISEYSLASSTLTQATRELSLAAQSVLDHKQAQEIAQDVARRLQETAHEQIASIVTRCLQSVFMDNYEFRIVFEKKRGKTEARFVFVLAGEEVDPLRNSAGGEVDVASFALRLAALLLHKPPLRRLLVLDEPMRCLSKNHSEAVAELFRELSEELGVQIIMVTHDKSLAVGKVIQF
jgi:ABC-type cobalamin/Fe3+-siderophores transport system ATPase subunit